MGWWQDAGKKATKQLENAGISQITVTSDALRNFANSLDALKAAQSEQQQAISETEDLKKEAEAGNADAQNSLAVCYEEGNRGMEQDLVQAARWYFEAAKKNHPDAMNRLADWYEKGKGDLHPDIEKALDWYRKAAEEGHANAQKSVARLTAWVDEETRKALSRQLPSHLSARLLAHSGEKDGEQENSETLRSDGAASGDHDDAAETPRDGKADSSARDVDPVETTCVDGEGDGSVESSSPEAEASPYWLDGTRLDLQCTEANLLGAGAFGQVYRARLDGDDVACKVIKQNRICSETSQLQREIRRLSALNSVNIVRFLGYSADPSKPGKTVMVTELMRGGALRCRVEDLNEKKAKWKIQVGEEKNPIVLVYPNLASVVRIALDVARGLKYLHTEKISHGDLKPQNILLSEKLTPTQRHQWTTADTEFWLPRLVAEAEVPQDAREVELNACIKLYDFPEHATAKLTDFGLSRRNALADTEVPELKSFKPGGTLFYFPPELLKAPKRDFALLAKADIYAFSMVLYELITLSQPWSTSEFTDLSLFKTLVIEGMRPAWPAWCDHLRARSDVMNELMLVTELSWSADPAKRQDASCLAGRLDVLLNRITTPTAPRPKSVECASSREKILDALSQAAI